MASAVSPIRGLRLATKVSQPQFAARLGVPAETYRMWDSGRRNPPLQVLVKAQELAGLGPDDGLLSLRELAQVLGVSVYRLREAAKDGRLTVVYDTRVVFGHLVPRATRLSGEAYKQQYYGKKARWTARPVPAMPRPAPPENYDQRLISLRSRLGLTQAQLAARIGAAGKAVVYQWESRKRSPSPLFWQRIFDLAESWPSGTTPARSEVLVAIQKEHGR